MTWSEKAHEAFSTTLEHPEDHSISAPLKFAGIKLGQDVMNVENQLRPGQLGNQGGKDFEIGDVMDMNEVVGVWRWFFVKNQKDRKRKARRRKK